LILKHRVVSAFQVNCFVLAAEKGGDCVVVDPGGNADDVARALEEDELVLKYILLTHAHVDHAGGVCDLQERCGGEVIMHRDDLPILEALEYQTSMFGLPPTRTPEVDRFVEDGDRIDVDGFHLDVIHTPGHSPGGVTYRHGDILFVGDALFAGSIGRTDLTGGSFEVLLNSIREKLFPLGDGMKVLSGHGPATTIGDERIYNPFLRDVHLA